MTRMHLHYVSEVLLSCVCHLHWHTFRCAFTIRHCNAILSAHPLLAYLASHEATCCIFVFALVFEITSVGWMAVGWMVGCCVVGWLVGGLGGLCAFGMVGATGWWYVWLDEWLSWLVGWLVGRLVGWLVGSLAGWLGHWLMGGCAHVRSGRCLLGG